MNDIIQYQDGIREMYDCIRMLEDNVLTYSYEAVVEISQRIMEQAENVSHEEAVKAYGMAYYYLGESARKAQLRQETGEYLLKSISYLQEAEEYKKLIEVYGVLGLYFGATGNSINAIECLLKGIEIGTGVDEYEVAKAYLQIGNNCMVYYNVEKATEYYYKAIEGFEMIQCRNTENYLRANIGMAFALYYQGKFEDSKAYLMKAQKCRSFLNVGSYPDLEIKVIKLLVEEKGAEDLHQCMVNFRNEENYTPILLDEEITIRMIVNVMLEQHQYDMAREFLDYLEKYSQVNKQSEEYGWWLKLVSLEVHNEEEEAISVMERGREYIKAYEMMELRKAEGFKKMLKIEEELDAIDRKKVELAEVRKAFGGELLYDTMTRLPNRIFLNDYLEAEFLKAKQKGEILTVGIIDIDNLENFNRAYGHLEGDKAIVKVAEALQEVTSEHLICGRYSGDEFALVGRGVTYEQLTTIAEGIRKRVQYCRIPNKIDEEGELLTVSQGYYLRVPKKTDLTWEYFARADANVNKMKKKSRDAYYIEQEV